MTGIGQRLRQERTRLKLSQTALGSIGGVETNAQGNYESGARSPKADYLLRIAKGGVDINYVLTGIRQPQLDTGINPAYISTDVPESSSMPVGHLCKVTHQLHANLHGLIEALYQMTRLIDTRSATASDETTKTELADIRADTHALAEASVRLIFVTSKLA